MVPSALPFSATLPETTLLPSTIITQQCSQKGCQDHP
jgi:hypothetical protein